VESGTINSLDITGVCQKAYKAFGSEFQSMVKKGKDLNSYSKHITIELSQ